MWSRTSVNREGGGSSTLQVYARLEQLHNYIYSYHRDHQND